ncbi:MAG: sulfatase-like hydrolase/transferase [Pirellulaceae bacterium]|nr:sulfatase-like hydrolase/transferase [Pirellulaceae bacterium]
MCLLTLLPTARAAQAVKRNVLLISIDDLNDWVGCMGGHPQAKTPAIDSLANRGTLFVNAHCQSPVCNPSRASLLTGRYPHSTGIYFLTPGYQAVPSLKNVKTMPERFADDGYEVMGVGKIFHGQGNQVFAEVGSYGDGDFTTSDLVLAFTIGGYVDQALAAVKILPTSTVAAIDQLYSEADRFEPNRSPLQSSNQ